MTKHDEHTLEALSQMVGVKITAADLLGLTTAMGCPEPHHRRETTTRTGWPVAWSVCPHCATRRSTK